MKDWSRTSYTFEDPAINPWTPYHVSILQEEQVHPLPPGLMPLEPHRITWNILAKHASWTPFYLRELGGRTKELPGYKQKNIKMWASPQDNCPFLQQVNGMEKVGEGGRVDFPDGPVVKAALPMQGAWVWPLIRELRSHMLHAMAKKKKKNKKKKLGWELL